MEVPSAYSLRTFTTGMVQYLLPNLTMALSTAFRRGLIDRKLPYSFVFECRLLLKIAFLRKRRSVLLVDI